MERAVGVLAARFQILARPSRFWYRKEISNLMKACVIIHNMVVEARTDTYESGMASLGLFKDSQCIFPVIHAFEWQSRTAMEARSGAPLADSIWAAKVVQREDHISSSVDHFALRRDLIAHIWAKHEV